MIKYVQKRKIKNLKNEIVPYDINKIINAIKGAFIDIKKRKQNTDIATINKDEILLIEKVAKITETKINKTNKNIISVEEIQDFVEQSLILENLHDIAKAYIIYRNDRSNIRIYNQKLMKKINEITYSESQDSNTKRENGNIDGNTAMGTMLQYGSAVSNEFSSKFILKKEIAYAHNNGSIHIHDKDFLTTGTTTCSQINLKKLFEGGFSTGHGFLREPNDIISYGALTAVAIQANQNDQHGGQAIPALDYFLATGVLKTFTKKFYDNFSKYLQIKFPEIDEEMFCNKFRKYYDKIDSIEITNNKKNAMIKVAYKLISLSIYSKKLSKKELDYEINNLIEFSLDKATTETNKQTYQAMEALVHNLNTLHSRAGAQVPFSSISFGTDISAEGRMISRNLLLAQEAGLGKGETPIFPILIFKVKKGVNFNQEDVNYDLFKLSMRVSAKRLFPNFSFIDAPYNFKYYKKGDLNSEVTYMGCRTRTIADVNGNDVVFGRGNISFTSINIVRLAIKHGICLNKRNKADMNSFYKELDELINLVIMQLLDRFEIQARKKVKNFPFLMGQGIWNDAEKLDSNDEIRDIIKHGSLSIGFIGLAEALKALLGKHHGESNEAQELGLKIISHMRNKCDEATKKYKLNFALLATPAEGLSGNFVSKDKKIFGTIPGITDREYYTNSFHVPVYYPISAFKKIDLEAPYHELTNGGHITYVEVDGDISKNLDAFESIIRYMCEKGIGYGSINHPIDRDPVCGFNGIIGDVCPKCGRKESKNFKFQRIRRITGYLVGDLNRFGDGKRAEESDRVKHFVIRK